MSPEAYSTNSKNGYNGLKADIFSLGMILFFLSFGEPAWKRPDKNQVMFRRLKEKGMENLLQSHPASRKYSDRHGINELADLLEKLLSLDPSERPDSIEEILQHPFLNDITEDSTYLSQSEGESDAHPANGCQQAEQKELNFENTFANQ